MKKFALLLLVLCAALVPIGGLAVPGWAATPVKTEDALRTAVQNNGEITLEDNITLGSTLEIENTGTITFDGNGHTLSLQEGKTGSVIAIGLGTPTINIKNLVIAGGNATVSSTENGGGISSANSANLTVTNCRFENNHAEGYVSTSSSSGGGAIYFTNGALKVENCTFTSNTTRVFGGAILVSGAESASITNCTFYDNGNTDNTQAQKGGGLYVELLNDDNNDNAMVNYCTFVSNRAQEGSEIYIDINEYAEGATATVKNSIVYGNVEGFDLDSTNLKLTSAPTAETEVFDKDKKVKHVVFRNHAELYEAVNKGNDTTVKVDQLGNTVTDKHDIGAVEIAAHVHDFTYSASGATLTATCRGADFCDLEDNKATLTLTAPTDLAYDGTAKTATVSGEIPGVTTPAIVYKQGTTELKSAPVNAGDYTANVTLTNVVQTTSLSAGSVTASVSFTITKKSATVTANPQTVKEGGSIATGTGQVTTSGLLSGHTLSAVTLTASSTASATTSGTITPGSATIKDGSGNDVTANYAITYEKGTLTVESGSSGGGETTPIDPKDPNITGVKLNITTDTNAVTLTPGETKKLNFTATATVTYKNGSTKSETARIKTWWRGDGAWPDWMKIHSSFSVNPNTVDLTPGKDVGGTTMTCRVAAETESYNGHTDWAECEFTVTVQASETFTPKNLFFEKPRVEMTVEPGNTVEDSCKVRLQLYGSRGTVKESTDGYTLVCRKANDSGASWVTSSVDGWTITFKSAPPADWHWSDSTIFVINAMDKDGKQYLSTSYLVVSYVSNVKSYQLTAAPTEVTVLAGKKDSVDLKKSVRFEKVYENGKRVLLDGAKLTFSSRTSDRVAPWMDLDSDGVVTLAPGADVEPGRYFCDYRAAANDNGRTGTSEGTLIVNVVNTGAPKITTETLPDVEVGTTYSAQMTAEGLSPISWDIVSGTLPEGLSFDRETGKLFGTPTQVSDYTFDVQARNSAGDDHRVFNLKVRDQKPSGWCWTKSKKATKSGSTGKWHAIFHVKNGTNVNYYNKSTTRDNLDKDHLKKVTKTKGARAGEGNIKYDLLWPKTNNKWEEYTYKFKVQAGNNAGTSTYEKSFTAAKTTGKLSVAGVSLAADDIILTDEDDGVETFEPYRDGETPEADDGQDEGVTYYANGGVDEEDGKISISAVIVKPGDVSEEGKEYVYSSLDSMRNALSGSWDKIVSVDVEFREGATVDVGAIRNLSQKLVGLAIDNGTLEKLDLYGMKKLEFLSLYGCESLTSLNVNECSNLASLSVMKCPKLFDLNVTGCGALENVDVMGAAITELDLSKRSGLATLNLNDCGKLATLNVAGCSALTDVSLNGTAIPYLDLSECSALTSLSLADAAALTELTLPSGASFDNFTLTGSRVGALTLKGTEKLTMLDLSGNAGLTTLALSGCSALSELDVSGCGFEILDLSGCTLLEKLNASECAAMTTLTLPVSSAQDVSVSDSATAGKLKELSVGGCAELRSLNVSGQSLGHLELDGLKWLTRVQCDGQFIGGRTMSENMDLKDYAGNCLYRVSDVQGYAADGSPVETSWNKDTGAVTFASVPESLSYAYDTGLYGCVLGVTVSTSSDPADGPDSPTSNRGGGGCDSGLGGGLALLGLAALSLRKRC